MKRWLRYWWRGWSDEDLRRALTKIGDTTPGCLIFLTHREFRAYMHHVADTDPLFARVATSSIERGTGRLVR